MLNCFPGLAELEGDHRADQSWPWLWHADHAQGDDGGAAEDDRGGPHGPNEAPDHSRHARTALSQGQPILEVPFCTTWDRGSPAR